ncbi:prepilin-type N-terminal cleavage/methylation domain-containing protein [Sulfurimonas sp.]|uniref:prepilin-type N-terminal cleavage/methylation domain-containing protein n=1 Tax=Sulfurimonas sp. TaxID=2022749 RepID=UPI00263986E7|nr:prepilin-type N-terminal cleavage/methylation domain-containing protein [Sulfurimonas sp.]MDD5158069.1 prepilin-type N-terminal cleavage/methylation domain-containing protein [Sulfurimonas sp.]
MVRREQFMQRYAFTMIELIFAIVIISIAVISLPTITDTNSRGIENGIMQEAVFAGSAELNSATSNYWDSRSMEDNNVSNLERVIDINSNCDNNRLKPGHINQPFHRRCLDSNTTTVNDINDTTFPNLNNAAHLSEDIFEHYGDVDNNVSAGYKNTYQSTVTVTRPNNSNVKTLAVTVTNGGTNIIILRTQSTNIGEVDYFKRRF